MFLQLLKLFVVEAGWDRELRKEECTHKAIITYIVAFRGTSVVESGCDRCHMLSSPQIRLYEETLAFTWCALKWKGTSLLIYLHALFMVIFLLAAVESHFPFHLKCVWIYILVSISLGFLQCAQVFICSLQMT